MSYLRLASRRAFQSAPTASIPRRAFATSFRAQTGYGDPTGGPAAENPQDQGKNTKVSTDKEHPGPAPPSTDGGKSSGGSTTKPSSQSKGSSKQPKIHGESKSGDESEDVKKHNAELDQRKEKSYSEDSGEKVDKEFWKG